MTKTQKQHVKRRSLRTEESTSRSIQLIAFLGFLYGLSISLLAYVTSSYFKAVIGSDNVSVFYFIIFAVALPLLFHLHRLVEGFGRARTLMLVLIVQIEVLFFLQFLPMNYAGAVLLMIYAILNSFVAVLIDIVLEAYSVDGTTGRLRGLYLSVWNFGVLVGPLISMYILDHFGFSAIFTAELLVYVAMFLAVFLALNNIRGHVPKQRLSLRKVVRTFRTRRDLSYIYAVSLALRFFYASMTVYMPLYLFDLGMQPMEVGLVFTVMLIPFILLQYPVGVLADKKYGEKEMMILGLIIMIGATAWMWATQRTDVWMWMALLTVSRVGAAILETMEDSYFYKQITAHDMALINCFRTTRPFAYIVCMILTGAVFFFFEMRSMFVVIMIVLALSLVPAARLRDTR